jgi:hypothetical protein
MTLENKADAKQKTTEEYLEKRLKSCKRNMQELCNSIERPNLQIMGIERGEQIQAKSMVNKITVGLFLTF